MAEQVILLDRAWVGMGPGEHMPFQTLNRFKDHDAQVVGGRHGSFGDLMDELLPLSKRNLCFATLDPTVAKQMVSLERVWFHAVALTQKVDWGRVLGGGPHNRDIAAFRSSADVHEHRKAPTCVVRRRNNPEGTHKVEDVLDWLWSNRHLVNPEKHMLAAFDFARVFAKSAEERAKLRLNLHKINRETLRLARVRLDCVQMLMQRALWELMDFDESLAVYLFCDGSPSFRGYELYASVMDIVHNDYVSRTLLPMVCLARSLLDRQGILLG